MTTGLTLDTPRFGRVEIETVFHTREDAWKQGYTEYTGNSNILARFICADTRGGTVWSKFKFCLVEDEEEESE